MIWIGTSGYNYPEWKGHFYPADLPAAKMLPYYAARFPTVEINYTFYRMPNEKLVGGWAAQTPAPYKLTLKAPRRIQDSKLLASLNCPHNKGNLKNRIAGLKRSFKYSDKSWDGDQTGNRCSREMRGPSCRPQNSRNLRLRNV